MKQQNIIKVNTDKDDNLIVTMKITSIKPIIETIKKYDKDHTGDFFEIEYPYILKNTINEIIGAYEEKLISVIDNDIFLYKWGLNVILHYIIRHSKQYKTFIYYSHQI